VFPRCQRHVRHTGGSNCGCSWEPQHLTKPGSSWISHRSKTALDATCAVTPSRGITPAASLSLSPFLSLSTPANVRNTIRVIYRLLQSPVCDRDMLLHCRQLVAVCVYLYQESSANAEITRHARRWMAPKCETQYCFIPHWFPRENSLSQVITIRISFCV